MSIKKLLIIIFIIIFVIGAYFLLNNKSSTFQKNETANITNTLENTKEYSGSFSIIIRGAKGLDNGIAVFKDKGDKTQVSIKSINMGRAKDLRVSLNSNICKDLGEVIFELSDLINNSSETTLNISFDEFLSYLPLSLTISVSSNSQLIACSDIVQK